MMHSETFDRCNRTELYQIARASGLSVLAGESKEKLIKYITGQEAAPVIAHDTDEWRLAIMRFVIEHRKQLEVQLRCPAKSMDPRACFQCVDEQVISCLIENKQNLELIQIHKKPIERPKEQGGPMTNAATVLNPTNAPRDREQLKAQGGIFQLHSLAKALGITGDKLDAFDKLEQDERVDTCLKLLLEQDEKAKGQGASPSRSANGNSTPVAQTLAPPKVAVAAAPTETRTPVTEVTPATAPRDIAQLAALSSFKSRSLAQALGMLESVEKTFWFGSLKAPDRAEVLLKALSEWDAQHSGAPQAAPEQPAPAGANGVSAQAPGTSVPAVDPAAFRSAQEATAPNPAGAGVRRQPKVAPSAGEGELGTLASAIQGLMTATSNQAALFVQGIGELRSELGAINLLGDKIDNLAERLLEATDRQTSVLTYTLMVLLTLAEERGIGGRLEILADAVGQAATLGPMLKEIGVSGKAA